MNPQVIGLFLFAITSGTVMSIVMKYLSQYNALWLNSIAMVVSSCILFVVYMIQKQHGGVFSFHRGMIVLGIALAGLNFGYSAIYGQGVALAYVPLIVTGGMTVLLGLVGYFFFHEPISWRFIVGALVILAGMGVMVME